MKTFTYHTALFQQGRITHADGAWLGSIDPREAGAIDTCPDLDVFLGRAGREGWELCATLPMAGGQATQLVFKR